MISSEHYEIITALVFLGFFLVSKENHKYFIPMILFFLLENLLIQQLISSIINFLFSPINTLDTSAINAIFQFIITLILRKKIWQLLPLLFSTQKRTFLLDFVLLTLLVGQIIFATFSYKKMNFYTKVGTSTEKALKISSKLNINTVFFLFLGFVLLFLIYASYEARKNRYYRRLETEKEMMEMYTSSLESLVSSIRKMQHDYKNLLSGINGFIKNDTVDVSGLRFFLIKNDLIQNDVQLKTVILDQIQNISLPEVKGLVSTKVIQAVQNKIKVHLECNQVIKIEGIDSFNLVRCLGIILDNAIEECQKYDQSEIQIAFIDDIRQTLIFITNTCLETNLSINIGESTKGNNRGIGLQNLHDLVKECKNLSISTSCENGTFTQKLFIRKK